MLRGCRRAGRRPPRRTNVNRIIATLARSGIAVVDEPADTKAVRKVHKPLSPVRLLRSQVENMALELAGDGGVPGATLDSLAPMPEGELPISYLIAGYIKSGKTPGARAAKKIMGKQDWAFAPEIAFPSLVLGLFVSDMTHAVSPDAKAPPLGVSTQAAGTGGPAGGASVRAGSVGTLCAALSGFISGGMGAIYDALTFEGTTAQIGELKQIWNTGVKFLIEGAGAVVGTVFNFVPFLGAVRTALGVVAAVHAITSLLVNWTVNLTVEPKELHFGVGNEDPPQGKFTATVDVPNSVEWPDDVQDCASLLGVTLPKLDPKGAPVTWTNFDLTLTPADLASYSLPSLGTPNATLDSDLQTELEFTVGTETPKEHAKGVLVDDDKTYAHIVVRRTDVEKLRGMLLTVILNQVPSLVRPLVNPKLELALKPKIEALTSVAQPMATDFALVKHHVFEACKYPQPSIDPCLIGEWESDKLTLPLPQSVKFGGGFGAIMTIEPNGELTIDYEPSLEAAIAFPGGAGAAKLHGSAHATIVTDNDEQDPGVGKIHGTSVSSNGLYADLTFSGGHTTTSFHLELDGSYVIENIHDKDKLDKLILTIPTSVGPMISEWHRAY